MANPEDLGRYHFKRLLGRGALGQVWEAVDREQEEVKVAVKIMHAADEELTAARVQFAREARLAALLRHPHLVKVQDAGEAAGTSFMVMEMVEGTPLRKLIHDSSIAAEEKLRWLRQIGDALAALHGAGFAHRDLKPENVIIRPDRTACLVDLGMAKWRKFQIDVDRDELEGIDDEPVPPSKSNVEYVPPETSESNVYDSLGDQFAWGVLAYAVLTGQSPRPGSPALEANEGVSPTVAAAIERARSPARADRWDRMDQLLDAIALPPGGKPSPPEGGGPAEPPPAKRETEPAPPDTAAAAPPPAKKAPVALAAGAAVAVLLVVLGLILAGLR